LGAQIKQILSNTTFNGRNITSGADIASDDKGTLIAIGKITVSAFNNLNASSSLTVINKAIEAVATERAKLGALQNRLEYTSNNLGTTIENLSASESRIRDTDMAKEMVELAKNQILLQSSQAMLAQANAAPQGVLTLLR
jgi:flagellin